MSEGPVRVPTEDEGEEEEEEEGEEPEPINPLLFFSCPTSWRDPMPLLLFLSKRECSRRRRLRCSLVVSRSKIMLAMPLGEARREAGEDEIGLGVATL